MVPLACRTGSRRRHQDAESFDRIAHDALLAKLSPSPSLRRQLRAWLKAGVLDHGTLFPTDTGTMQRVFPAHFGERRTISEGYRNSYSIM